MVKHISIIYRRPGVTHEENVRYWKEVHSQTVKTRLPGLRKYVGNFPVEPPDAATKQPGGGAQMTCDAIVELHFDSLADLHHAMASDAWLSDERKKSSATFIDYPRLQYVVCEEVVEPL